MHLFSTTIHKEASLVLCTPDGDAWVTHVRFAQTLTLAANQALLQESKPESEKRNK